MDDKILSWAKGYLATNQIPSWLSDLTLKSRAEIAHFFILWGNINDFQKNTRGEYMPLRQYLKTEVFKQRDLVLFYSLSSGLEFANEDMEKFFRSRFLNNISSSQNNGNRSAAQTAAKEFQRNQALDAPLSQLIGESSTQTLRFLEKVLIEENIQCSLIIDFAHNVAPNREGGPNLDDRINTEILERWAKNDLIRSANNMVILLSPSLACLDAELRSTQSEAIAIRIPKPNENERSAYWAYNLARGNVKSENGLTPKLLGHITNGLSLKQIASIYRLAKEGKIPITLSLIKDKKREILEKEFGERVRIVVPQWGFDFFGGKDYLKRYMLEIRDNIVNGTLRRIPMGILASGPPGTGKTFFFECWAHECGFNFIEIVNPRSKWVGESEEIVEKIFSTIDDLSPVIVVEDEADQSEPSRDSPSGDSGVSNRLRQMKFQFTSDPKRRGKVIWVRITNRADLLDDAYKREGRSDDTIPFLMPETVEYEAIFKTMFIRYKIPTNITDFSHFARIVAKKMYCTGASIEWMVREADMYAGRNGKNIVETTHLQQAIDDWEIKLNPSEIDRQTIIAIEGSSKRLRPKEWETILAEAKKRLNERKISENKQPYAGKAS